VHLQERVLYVRAPAGLGAVEIHHGFLAQALEICIQPVNEGEFIVQLVQAQAAYVRDQVMSVD
jgi:hypothetical protein